MWKLRTKYQGHRGLKFKTTERLTRGDCEEYYRLILKPLGHELMSLSNESEYGIDPIADMVKL